LDDGGTFVLVYTQSAAENQALADLGTSMQFEPSGGVGHSVAPVVNDNSPFMANLPVGTDLITFDTGIVNGGTALVNIGQSPIVAVEAIGQGSVLAVATSSLLNNTVGLYTPFGPTAANDIIFWHNIVGGQPVPEPTSFVTIVVGVTGVSGCFRWRCRRLRST
jgi:hypothetical protein